MVKVVRESLATWSAPLLLVEPIAHVGEPERGSFSSASREENLPCVLCINKIDTVEKKEALLAVIAAHTVRRMTDFDAIIPISARTGDGLEDLMAQLQRYAVEGPQLFPDGMTTDQPDSQVCAEIVRGENAAVSGQGDPPRHGGGGDPLHRAGGHRHYRPGRDHLLRKGQPQGHYHRQGRARCSSASAPWPRQDIEKFMGTKVYMETWVKVKENWRDNVNFIRSQGYNESEPFWHRCCRPVFPVRRSGPPRVRREFAEFRRRNSFPP